MKAKLKYKGKEIEIPDVEKVSGMGKYTGLMLKKENALLFEFEKGRKAIHSLLCPDFLAIWLDGSKIVDYKIITSAKLKIMPQKDFNKLLEIPLNNKYSSVVEFFLSEEKFK